MASSARDKTDVVWQPNTAGAVSIATVGDRGAVGIVGCGHVTRTTIRAFLGVGGRVAWVVDPNAAARDSFVSEVALLQGVEPSSFTTLDEALRRGDSSVPVMINSPGSLHLEHIEAAARASRPMLVAKPLALDWSETERALAMAVDAGVGIDVAEQYPDEAHARHIRALLDRHGPPQRILLDHRKPASGQTTLVGRRQTGILEYAVHHYALLASWLEQPPTAIAVDSWTGNGGRSGEGSIGHAWIHFESCHVLHAFGFGGERTTYRAEFEAEGVMITAIGSHLAAPDVEVAVTVDGVTTRDAPPVDLSDAWSRLYARWLASSAGHSAGITQRIRVVAAMVDAALRATETGAVIDLRGDRRYRGIW